jgi:hypothetical protein
MWFKTSFILTKECGHDHIKNAVINTLKSGQNAPLAPPYRVTNELEKFKYKRKCDLPRVVVKRKKCYAV